ncbi:MAG: sensor histidine kinase [SAR324 cluster bacterium]|nr:sensor histidine kinase [SAR324 cluster bacterium]
MKKSSGIFKKWLSILTIVLVLLATVMAFGALERIRARSKQDVQDTLKTVLATTQGSFHLWIDHRKDHITHLFNIAAFQQSLVSLAKQSEFKDDSAFQKELERVKEYLNPIIHDNGDKGFFLISPEMVNIASMGDSNIGKVNLIYEQRRSYLKRVFLGETVFVPPIHLDVSTSGGHYSSINQIPTLFVVAPVKNAKNETVAAFALSIDPSKQFNRLAQLGRVGDSGETYAFDSIGILITESRFDDQLRRIGLVKPHGKGFLTIKVTDPGENLLNNLNADQTATSKPLTLMAKAAIAGFDGVNTEGYRDYRGVKVFGAWLWDKELGFGLTTQINQEEAMESYVQTRNTLLMVLALIIFLVVLGNSLLYKLKKNSEASIIEAYEKLEGLVTIRTQELNEANLKLENAVEQLQTLNSEKDEFLGIAAHGLKTPLTIIGGFAKRAEKRSIDLGCRVLQRYLAYIFDSTFKMGKLVEDLLLVNEIDDAKQMLALESTSFDLAVNEVLDQLQPTAKNKEILLVTCFAAERRLVTADPEWLRRLIANLVSNAIKYSLPNTTVKAFLTQTENSFILTVQDKGLGISSEEQQLLFQRFARLSAKPTADESSTGLGLFIVKKIVEKMNGKVWCESELGQGSSFFLQLPMAIEQAD